MAIRKLMDIAIARSGDKGNSTNIGVIANSEAIYAFLKQNLTATAVKQHFKEICFGEVIRYELPNLKAFNFVLNDSLDGGGTETMRLDAQGKVHGLALLHLEMDVPDDLLTHMEVSKI